MKTDPLDPLSKVTFLEILNSGTAVFFTFIFWVKRRPKAGIKLVPSNRLWKRTRTVEHILNSGKFCVETDFT